MNTAVTTLSDHLRTTLMLSLPLLGANLAQMGIGVADTIMVGWLGTDELAALVLATQLWFVVWLAIAGFSFGLSSIVANALGDEDERGVRRAMRMGIWCVTGWGLLGMLLLSQADKILTALGQEPHLVAMAKSYLSITVWALIPPLLAACFRGFLTALEDTRVILIAGIASMLLNIFLNWVLIFGNLGAPALGINGSAWATLVTNVVLLMVMVAYVAKAHSTRRYEVFVRLHLPDWPMLREVNKIGAPIAFTLIVETALFWFSSIMMGWISVVSLAAHGIVLQLISIAFMFPLCISQVATVRVGRAIGARDGNRRNLASDAALLWGVGLALLAAIIFVAIPGTLIRAFLEFDNADAPMVVSTGIPLLMIAALFQFGDGLQVVALGILRGAKDTATPMRIAIFSYWVIAAPLGYILAFPMGWGGPGVWTGLGIGLSIAAALLILRVFRSFRMPIRGTAA